MSVYVIDTETQPQYAGFQLAFVWGVEGELTPKGPNFGNPPNSEVYMMTFRLLTYVISLLLNRRHLVSQ